MSILIVKYNCIWLIFPVPRSHSLELLIVTHQEVRSQDLQEKIVLMYHPSNKKCLASYEEDFVARFEYILFSFCLVCKNL